MLNPIKTSDFDAIRLKLASPEQILDWSNGEVTKPEQSIIAHRSPRKMVYSVREFLAD